jgi:transcriptional regulator with XRE-family HTH domain
MDTQQKISERIKGLLKDQGYSAKPFGEKLGIYNLGRMLNNERNWTLKNLEKIAGALGVTVGALAQDFVDIPILIEATDEPFMFPLEIKKERALGWVPAPIPVYGGGEVSKMYAISVKNVRIFKKPKTLIIEKDSHIESGDQVVYCCPEGFGHIGEITLYEDKMLFKALDPMDPFQDKLLDRGQLRMMDRVSYTRH